MIPELAKLAASFSWEARKAEANGEIAVHDAYRKCSFALADIIRGNADVAMNAVIPELVLTEAPISQAPTVGSEVWVLTFHGAPTMRFWDGSAEMLKCLRHGIYFRTKEGADAIRHHVLDALEAAVKS